MKRVVSFLCAVCLLLPFCGCKKQETPPPAVTALPVTGEVEIAVLSLGKADAIVITTATKTVVIDAGEIDDGGKVINYLNQKGRNVIDHLIITHYDRDHVGGADRLLNFSEVKQVIRPDYDGVREEYSIFLDSVSGLEIPDIALAPGSEDYTLTVEDLHITINSPLKSAYVNAEGVQQDNNFSLIIKAQHGAKTFLFAGDAEDERLAELITSETNWQAEFLKIPYHGNFTELSAAFFQRVKPSYAVACDSDKNPTADETKAALAVLGCKTYGTMNGTVVCKSDGTTLTVTQLPKE